MTRVLYVEANEDGTVGGSHKIQADLVRRLSSAFEPVVLHYQDNVWAQRLRDAGVEVHTWDDERRRESAELSQGGKLATLRTLRRVIAMRSDFIRENRIDIVHLNNSPYIGFDDWLPACRKVGIPCVVYAMGDARVEPNIIRRLMMRRFDHFFPLSKLVAKNLAANGMAEERTTLTYPGLPVEELQAGSYRPRAEVRAEFGIADDKLLAVMVGNLRHWKGQHVVLEGLSLMDERTREKVELLFVGDPGPDTKHEDWLREMARDLGVADTVQFLGHRSDVPHLLEAADIGVHASVIPEPFGLVVLEAMIHGCAVLAADAGGPVEMLTPESGRLFDTTRPQDFADRLGELVTDAELRSSLAAGARERAREFEVQDHVDLVESVYRGL